MTKQMIKAKISDIFEMGEMELVEFNQELNMSLTDDKSKMYIQIAIDDRLSTIKLARETGGAFCVEAELKEGEL